ncbi:tetratricopeptide repeat protein [Methanosarcina vacuolata]|uniref:NB-ARC domain-containing protein n=1 Tax=Methanosarcina vacuolata Z-761 TaxID=1434123 RepID=A0A0E3LHH9_9EURY|nr:tetratricopeptide repeat protein [Methanosarcina vacuolata]AKB44301.1 hypothetical protein MSVAZ_2032 [Methanosarcina vacuolata Z-761]
MEADEPSVPIIDVGGNFTQGNISGQSAIGSNISQIQYTNCTFVYPDGSTKQGYSWIYTQGARLIIDPKRVFGRETELEKIENYLEDNSALVITGLRGTGKSTLASMFVDRMGESGKFAGIYWRKVDETTDISEIIGSFFTVIGKPVKDLERYKILDQINLLFNELNEASYLLVLDNFEVILDPQTNKPLESKVGFSELIESAKESCIRSKILFTSWDSLASERGIRPFSYQIRGLDTSAGILLLRHEGLLNESETELKKAIKLSDGHPLALILLAQLVREEADTLSTLLNDGSLWIGEEGEVAENILAKIYRRLSEDERELLQYISIFRQPAPTKAIEIVANHPKWTERRIKKVALKLAHKSLIQKTENGYYWEESLICRYAGTQLSEKLECHKLACKYYLSFSLPAKPAKKEDVQSLIEAHYHACMAEEYNQCIEIIVNSNLHHLLDLWGSPRTLIELYTKLLPNNPLKDKPLLNIESHIFVLGNLGIAYNQIGETKKAIEYYELALELSRNIGNRNSEGSLLCNLGISYRDLSKFEKSIEYFEQALQIAKDLKNKEGEGNLLGNLGSAYRCIGKLRQSIEFYEQALRIARDIGNRRIEEHQLENIGNVYYSLKEFKKAEKYNEQAILIAKELGDVPAEGLILGNMGSIHRSLGKVEKAIEYHKKSLYIARKIEDRRLEENQLINLGNAYSDFGDVKKAVEYYEQALVVILKFLGDEKIEKLLEKLGDNYLHLNEEKKSIIYYKKTLQIVKTIENKHMEARLLEKLCFAYVMSRNIEKAIEYGNQAILISKEVCDRKIEGESLENFGFIYTLLGDPKKAIEYYLQALYISRELGDKSIERENLRNLGSAYYQLGEVKKADKYYEQANLIKETSK